MNSLGNVHFAEWGLLLHGFISAARTLGWVLGRAEFGVRNSFVSLVVHID